jgi:hypothetical protein
VSDPKLDPALCEMLDAFVVPPLSSGFADRAVAAAAKLQKPLPAPVPSRGGRRGRWIRGHRVVIGVVALGLMSAGAAATAIFGHVAQTIPVIGPLIAGVVSAKPQHKPKLAVVAKPKPDEGAAPLVAEEAPPAPLPLALPERIAVRHEIRREFVAERIAAGLKQRDDRRGALGLPPKPPRPAQIIPILRRIPPADRAAVIERVREIRQEQRAAELGLPDRAVVVPELNAAIAPKPEPMAAPLPDAQPPDASAPARAETLRTPERIEQLRRLRALRELQQRRREMRRQRLQQ